VIALFGSAWIVLNYVCIPSEDNESEKHLGSATSVAPISFV